MALFGHSYHSVTGGFWAGRDIGVITYGSLNTAAMAGRDVAFVRAIGDIDGVISAGQNIGGASCDRYRLGAVSSRAVVHRINDRVTPAK